MATKLAHSNFKRNSRTRGLLLEKHGKVFVIKCVENPTRLDVVADNDGGFDDVKNFRLVKVGRINKVLLGGDFIG